MKKVMLICIPILVIALVLILSYPNFKKNKVSNVKYLSANYALALLEEMDDYLDESELKEGSIKASKIVSDSKYSSCDGEVIVKKLDGDLYSYTITTSCETSLEDKKLTIQVYQNVNQKSSFQIVTNVSKHNSGYVGVLTDYDYEKDDTGEGFTLNGVSGFVTFNDKFEILKFNLLDSSRQGIGTNISFLEDGVLLKEIDDNDKLILSYYDYDLNLKVKKEYEDLTMTNFVYEDKENIYIGDFNLIYRLEKDTLNETLELTLPNLTSYGYDNGKYYSSFENNFYVYDKSGKELSKTPISKDIIKTVILDNIYVADMDTVYLIEDGSVKKTLGDTTYGHILSFDVNDKITILYDNSITYQGDNDSVGKGVLENSYTLLTYDLEGNLLNKKVMEKDYGVDVFKKLDFSFEEKMRYSYFLENKVLDIYYSNLKNGTEIFFIYE